MQLQDIKQALSEMDNEELVDFIANVRKSRTTQKAEAKPKKASKGAGKKPKSMKKLTSKMSQTDMQSLIEQLKEELGA